MHIKFAFLKLLYTHIAPRWCVSHILVGTQVKGGDANIRKKILIKIPRLSNLEGLRMLQVGGHPRRRQKLLDTKYSRTQQGRKNCQIPMSCCLQKVTCI